VKTWGDNPSLLAATLSPYLRSLYGTTIADIGSFDVTGTLSLPAYTTTTPYSTGFSKLFGGGMLGLGLGLGLVDDDDDDDDLTITITTTTIIIIIINQSIHPSIDSNHISFKIKINQ